MRILCGFSCTNMAILSLNHKIFLRFSKLSLTKPVFYTFMQTPSGKTGDFPDGKLISMLPSGKTGGFPDGKTISMLSSGKTDGFPDGKRISMLSSEKTGDFPDGKLILMLRSWHSAGIANGQQTVQWTFAVSGALGLSCAAC